MGISKRTTTNNEMETTFKASLSQGRQKWCVIFCHPMIPDETTGRPGLRVRRGLGTGNRRAGTRVLLLRRKAVRA